MSKQSIAIFDLDGCLTDDRRRRPLLPPENSSADRYDAYHVGMEDDPPINLHVLNDHISKGHHILFITARPIKYRFPTLAWLEKHLAERSSWSLQMRYDLEAQPELAALHSPRLKTELFKDWASSAAYRRYGWDDVVAAYDDRPDVLEAYRLMGVDNCVLLTFESESIEDRKREAAADELRDHQGRIKLKLDEADASVQQHWAADAIIEASSRAKLSPMDMKVSVPSILNEMAETFEDRSKTYKANYMTIPLIMTALFPEGVPLELLNTPQFGLFEMQVVKLTRFVTSGLTHVDSQHDIAVYAAMIESVLRSE